MCCMCGLADKIKLVYTHMDACVSTLHGHDLLNFVEQQYHREVLVVPVDFSRGMEVYPYLAEQLKDLDIGILGENSSLRLPTVTCGVLCCYNIPQDGFNCKYLHVLEISLFLRSQSQT